MVSKTLGSRHVLPRDGGVQWQLVPSDAKEAFVSIIFGYKTQCRFCRHEVVGFLRGGCSRGGGNWGTLRIPREDWGTLGNIRED